MTDQDRAALAAAWGRCEAWLSAYVPIDHAALQPGATPDELASLEEQLGFPLHPQLKALLEFHNGVLDHPERENYHAGAFLPLGHRLSTTARIASQHAWLAAETQMIAEIGQGSALYAHAHQWVPFAHPNDGGLAFVDHGPGTTYGHVYEMGIGSGSDAQRWASSLTELFENLATSLETDTPFRTSLETDTPFRDARPTPHELPSGHFCLTWGRGRRREHGTTEAWPPARHPAPLRPARPQPRSEPGARPIGRIPVSGTAAPPAAEVSRALDAEHRNPVRQGLSGSRRPIL